MQGVVNGTRLVERFDLLARVEFDPNKKLRVVNDVKAVTEEEQPKASGLKKIAAFKPEILKNANIKARFDQLRAKRRKADVNEVILKVKSKVNMFKQISLQNSRFAKEIGKGSVLDVSA